MQQITPSRKVMKIRQKVNIQSIRDLLLIELIDELRLKLRILFNFVNYLEISLNFYNIFFYYSLFFYISNWLRFLTFFEVQHDIFGPVDSIFVINLIFSSNSSSQCLKESNILNLLFDEFLECTLKVLTLTGL